MFGLLDWIKVGIGAASGAAVVALPVYLHGKAEGRQQAAVAALETSVRILRQRNEIDGQVSTSDAAALCGDFGLSDDDKRECVRRLGEDDAEP